MVRGSGTGDTNRGNLLNLVANRSISGWCHLLHNVWKTSGRIDNSVWMVWPVLDHIQLAWNVLGFEGNLSPGAPGQDSPQKGTQWARPHDFSLFMYDTTVVLSVARTILFEQRSWNSFRAKKTTFSSM